MCVCVCVCVCDVCVCFTWGYVTPAASRDALVLHVDAVGCESIAGPRCMCHVLRHSARETLTQQIQPDFRHVRRKFQARSRSGQVYVSLESLRHWRRILRHCNVVLRNLPIDASHYTARKPNIPSHQSPRRLLSPDLLSHFAWR